LNCDLPAFQNQLLHLCHTPGPNLTTRAQLLSFNRTQSRVVIDLTGHNTLQEHLYVMGLSNNPICRKCGTEEKTSVHISLSCARVCVWERERERGLGFTQTCTCGILLFGPWGCYETKYWGHL